MNRWTRFGVLLWLAIASVIVVVGVVRLFDSPLQASISTSARVASIDGAPASSHQEFHCSIVMSSGTPAWVSRTLYLCPADPGQRWRATAIEKPFHLTFIKPDGSRTAPCLVEFRMGIGEGWAPDGSDLLFKGGLPGYPSDAAMFRGRIWNGRVVLGHMLELIGWICLVGFGVALLTWIFAARARAVAMRNPFLCRHCGYDLRGGDTAGCPECGAGRTAELASDGANQ